VVFCVSWLSSKLFQNFKNGHSYSIIVFKATSKAQITLSHHVSNSISST